MTTTPTPTASATPSPKQTRRRLRTAILAQLFGVLGMQSFQNGILLLYMTVLGISPVRIITYLALPNGLSMLLRLPVAYLGDRFGKKRIGSIGLVLVTLGYGLFPVAAMDAARPHAEALIVVGTVILAIGKMLFAAGWSALLCGIIPEDQRGRFFGTQRLFYQVCGIAFAGICSWLLGRDSPLDLFQSILIFLTICFGLRAFLYRYVPEVDAPRPEQPGFWPALSQVLRAPGYASFCAYIFLLSLFTAGSGNLFALVEKHVMSLTEGQVVLLANVGMVGGVLGFLTGGRIIDRIGTKYVFLVCHFAFGLGLHGFLMRQAFLPLPPILVVGCVHFLLGVASAASSIAISTEMLALIPVRNKALSTSLGISMTLGGGALSSLLAAGMLNVGVLQEQWTFLGQPLSQYDAIIMAYGGMVVLMVVTLGLVPSVLRKAEWIPRGQ